MPQDLPLQEGDVLKGKYRIIGVIGAGGMGAVLEAQHLVLDQRVALKLVLPQAAKREANIERFLREGRAASKLRSEHVARVLDVDTLEDGLPYLVMELLEGEDLARRLKAGPMPIEEACELGIQACEALAEAHSHGIVHRDIKPANLFITRRPDGSLLVKVLDFGIAKQLDLLGEAVSADALTRSSAMIGSPLYMSPEQMRSARKVDERTDVWSMGVVLYHALSGKLPFEADSLGDLIMRVVEERPPPLSARRQGPPPFPEELSQGIMKCLERKLEDRYQNIGQLAAALAPFAPPRCQPLVARAQATLAASARPSRPSLPSGDADASGPHAAPTSTRPALPEPLTDAGRPSAQSTDAGAAAAPLVNLLKSNVAQAAEPEVERRPPPARIPKMALVGGLAAAAIVIAAVLLRCS